MDRYRLAPVAAVALLIAGCSWFRWSGHPNQEISPNWYWSAADLAVSTQPASGRPALPPAPEKLPETLYYTDLGPDAIDVSAYPAQQQYNYKLFAQECARCHTLARAVNSPVQSRFYWHYHIARMSLHSRLQGEGRISPDQTRAILDFLEYDAQERKVKDKKRFDAQTEELQRRFQPILQDLLERMREKAQPKQ